MLTNEFDTENGKYTIKSYGNGWAYEVVDIGTGESLWFQDDAASQLQADTNDFCDTCTIDQYFECLEG